FIVDDSNLLIDGLVRFFKESKDIEFVGRANSPYECMQQIGRYIHSLDIILMDVVFPRYKKDGIQLSKEIKEKYPNTIPRIAFMTITDKALVDAQRGFHGIIPKNEGIEQLISKLKAVHYDQAVFPPPSKPSVNIFDLLNATQKKILCLLVQNDSHKQLTSIFNSSYLESQKKIILRKINNFGLKVDNLNDYRVADLVHEHSLCDEADS
ncbi:MAG: response regulator, partial [Bacteroidota bacterium]